LQPKEDNVKIMTSIEKKVIIWLNKGGKSQELKRLPVVRNVTLKWS